MIYSTAELFWLLAWAWLSGSVFGYWLCNGKEQHPVIEEQMRKKYQHSIIADIINKPVDGPPVLYDLNNPLDAQVLENKKLFGI